MLVDRFGNALKVDRAALTEEIAGPSTAGVRRYDPSGISTGLTPSRLAQLLKSSESQDPRDYFALAEEMEEKETQYLTVLGSRKRAVCQLDINVEPAGDTPDDEANADLVRQWLQRDTLEDELFDIMDAVGKGMSTMEIVWETSASQWMPDRLEWVHPTFIEFDPIDLSTPMLKDVGGPRPFPAYKFIFTQIRAKSGIPVRSGLARPVAWAFLFKNFDLKGWVQFMEVYGQPLRLGKHHDGATEEQKRILLRAVRDIGADAAAVIPKSMEIEFVSDKGSRGGDGHQALAEYLDHQISKVVLGQSTTTDAIAGGHAVSQEHNEVRLDIERADAKALAATLNHQLVRPLIILNRGPQKAYPRIRIGRPDSVDLEKLTGAVDRMSAHMPFSQTQIRNLMGGLKAPESEEDRLGGAPVTPPPTTERRALAAQQAPRDVIERDFTGELLDDEWQELLDPIVSPVRDLVETASSYDEVRDQLISRLKTMDSASIEEMLARSGFAVRMAAGIGAVDEDDAGDN